MPDTCRNFRKTSAYYQSINTKYSPARSRNPETKRPLLSMRLNGICPTTAGTNNQFMTEVLQIIICEPSRVLDRFGGCGRAIFLAQRTPLCDRKSDPSP